eukprot:COSAG04_NODE_3336_length_2916_cov_1.844870_2_plen_190_part_00
MRFTLGAREAYGLPHAKTASRAAAPAAPSKPSDPVCQHAGQGLPRPQANQKTVPVSAPPKKPFRFLPYRRPSLSQSSPARTRPTHTLARDRTENQPGDHSVVRRSPWAPLELLLRASPLVCRTPLWWRPARRSCPDAREEAERPEHSPKAWAEDQAEDRVCSASRRRRSTTNTALHRMKKQVLVNPHPS